jgi:hypothetical protein
MRVSKLEVAMGAAAILALTALAGCSGPPWTLNQSPSGIALRWYPDATPAAAADQVAQLHCGSWAKSAELVSNTEDGSAQIAEYHCR